MSLWQAVRSFFAGPPEPANGGGSLAWRGALWARLGLRLNLVLGVLAILGYALTQSSWGVLRTASLGLLLASASFLVGATLGFLFGIPGTLQHSATPEPAAPKTGGGAQVAGDEAAPAAASGGREPVYRSNTSLEQISDWLTKILVGLSLTQWEDIRDSFQQMVEYIAPAFGESGYREVFVGGTIVLGVICGFFAGYLPTRLFLWLALTESDIEGSSLYDERKNRNLREAEILGGPETAPGEAKQAVVPGESDAVRRQVGILARQYDELRASLSSGGLRTQRMEEICSQLRKLAPSLKQATAAELQGAGSPGERLAAVAWSQVYPQLADLGWLADRIGAEKPFIGYHAGLALLAAARNRSIDAGQVLAAIQRAQSLLEPTDAGSDRARILAEAEQAARSRL